MAHYITADGRVQSFEAEVKSDGTVRPKNYHEFNKDDSSGEMPSHSAELSVVKYGERYITAIRNDRSVMAKIKDEIRQYLKSLNLSQQENTYLTALFKPCKIVKLSTKSIKKLQAEYSNSDLITLEKAINDLNYLLFRHDIVIYKKPIKVRLVPSLGMCKK